MSSNNNNTDQLTPKFQVICDKLSKLSYLQQVEAIRRMAQVVEEIGSVLEMKPIKFSVVSLIDPKPESKSDREIPSWLANHKKKTYRHIVSQYIADHVRSGGNIPTGYVEPSYILECLQLVGIVPLKFDLSTLEEALDELNVPYIQSGEGGFYQLKPNER